METVRDKSTLGNPTRPPATLEEFMLEHEKVIMTFLVHHADIYGNTIVYDLAETITSKPTDADKIRMFDTWAEKLRESYRKYRC